MAPPAAAGAGGSFGWARGSTASAAAPASSTPMMWIRMRLSHRVTRPACLDTRGVDLDGHARLQQVDREHEPPFGRLLPDKQAFDADERTLDDADAIAMVEVHVREDRHARADETLDGVDFVRGDRRQPRPAAVENPHDTARLQNLHVAGLVHGVSHEEVAGKDRHGRDARFTVASRPHRPLGQEWRERIGGELFHHQAFAVAARPDRVPLVVWQGFAPFGLRWLIRKRFDMTLNCPTTWPSRSPRAARPALWRSPHSRCRPGRRRSIAPSASWTPRCTTACGAPPYREARGRSSSPSGCLPSCRRTSRPAM